MISRDFQRTKNKEHRRIPINQALIVLFNRHPRHIRSPYVFCNREGKLFDNVVKALKNAAQRAEIKDFIGLHQLRHAFCSHCLMQGIDPRTVQKWMGHKDLATTLRYAHVSAHHEKLAIERLHYNSSHYMDTTTEYK